MQSVRNSYRKRGFSKNATNIIMSSWRSSTKREYQVHISKWIQFCSRRKIDSISVSVQDAIEFLTIEYEKGLSYSSINTSRAALSSLGIMLDNFTAGTHPIVIRFMKGVFNSRPTKPRYPYTWDVDKVLNYLKTLSPVRQLSLKDLTLKLTMLIVLTNAARVQSVHMLTVKNLKKTFSQFILQFRGLLKQSRPSYDPMLLSLKAYPPDRRLCVYTVLKEYLMRTKLIRGEEESLLISYIKPHTAVTKNTISWWIKTVMIRSGIEDTFGSHSARSAVVSKVKLKGLPIKDIMDQAGWSVEATFTKFYHKKIQNSNKFEDKVLSC